MTSLLAKFLNDESGATAIEYALIAAGIALAIITALESVSASLNGKLNSVSSALK